MESVRVNIAQLHAVFAPHLSLRQFQSNSPHVDVENGELDIGDLVDQVGDQVEGFWGEGTLGEGERSQATEWH